MDKTDILYQVVRSGIKALLGNSLEIKSDLDALQVFSM